MSQESVKISFYSITECGYYKRNNPDAPCFGKIDEILSELMHWVNDNGGLSLCQTKTFEQDELEDIYPTYCFDLINDNTTGDYLLITWNEMPSYDGTVASVNGFDTVGSATVSMTEIPQNSIPGYATYFWFLPRLGIFSTIQTQVNNKLNGQKNMKKYIHEFMAKFTSYVVKKTNTNSDNNQEDEILGYTNSPSEKPQKLYPRFETSLYQKSGEIRFIKENRLSIQKIIRKNKVDFRVNKDVRIWQKLLEYLGLTETDNSSAEENNIHFKYEIDLIPTEDELNTIIDEWNSVHSTKWDNIGFMLKDETSPRWISHSIAKGDFNLELERNDVGIVSARSLLDALLNERQRILGLLEDIDNTGEA